MCNFILTKGKNKGKNCSFKGKYNGYCKRHQMKPNNIIQEPKTDIWTKIFNESKTKKYDELRMMTMLGDIYRLQKIEDTIKPQKNTHGLQCEVCYMDFDGETKRENLRCHQNICKDCVKRHIEIKIKDKDILPYIRCPAEDCKCAIPYYNLVLMPLKTTYDFINVFSEKMMCRTDTKPNNPDKDWADMLKKGIIRLCPLCKDPQMKEKGICNVIQCNKCSIWWNWRTNAYANTSRELKNKSRVNGSLWEKGELEYQMNLQNTDKNAFKSLLERNGMVYNPNYIRGN